MSDGKVIRMGKKSEWRVTTNYIAADEGRVPMYGVYRLRDVDGIDHSGNRETLDRWFEDRDLAEDVARIMNEEEEE